MIVQAEKPIRVFGTGKGKVIAVFAGEKVEQTFNEDKWCLELSPRSCGGPFEMELNLDGERVVIEDVYVGQVLLCGGQSNMQMKMKDEITKPEKYVSDDLLRLYYVDRPEENPITENMGWLPCRKEMVANWPAIPYLTGLALRKKGIAVGVVSCNQGASVIQSWMRPEYLSDPDFDIPLKEKFVDHYHELYGRWNPNTYLYHTMLEKLLPYSFDSVLWYQGESNASSAEGKVYLKLLQNMIANWREDFKDADLPFIVVQIADFTERDTEGWHLVQKAQAEIEKVMENVHTVRCADICENTMIHPVTKWKLAERIANLL